MTLLLQNYIKPLSVETLAAIEARGFDAEQFIGLGLAVGDYSEPALDDGNVLAIGYREQGQVVAIRTGTLASGLADLQGGRWLGMAGGALYNVDCLRDPALADEPLLVVERELACWAAMVAGFRRVVAVPTGQAGTGRSQPHLEAAADLLRDVPRIIIATFDDEGGQRLRDNIADTLGRQRCQWLRYPKGCADLTSTLRRYGVKGVQETIARASWYALPGFYAMSELPEPPPNPAFGTGIVGLDEHLRLRRGDMSVISGTPNAGKTTFANEVFCRLAKAHGFRSVWASFEQRPKPDHLRNLRTFYAEKPAALLSPAERAAADRWIDEHFRFLVPDDDTEASLDWLLEQAGAAVGRFDPFAVIVDPWNALEHRRPQGMSLTEYVGQSLDRIKRFARRRRVHMCIVAHPAKMQRNRDGEYPRPSLYDISDSAHWFNKTDQGVMIWRKAAEKEAEICVAKSKFYDELGTPGSIRGIFNRDTGRYTISDDGSPEMMR